MITKNERLEDIGFYTLSDKRAKNIGITSPLARCELILTSYCNLRCPYCRGVGKELQGNIPVDQALKIIDLWIANGLKNIRFSGGEPTLYKGWIKLLDRCREGKVERIAISTNGTANINKYLELIEHGVNDFSISLDGSCCSAGMDMNGGIIGAWEKSIETIRQLSKITYVTVGMVFTESNVDECVELVMFADSLGVSDIRVIPSAQYNRALTKLTALPREVLAKYPILNYRINNIKNGFSVRGIHKNDCHKCPLVLDDMAVASKWHFPCIIYMREGGKPIGKIGDKMRQDRLNWMKQHDTHTDPICANNCLDVCRDFNNKASEFIKDDK
jgi:MoaA/NifB/PqqE/SkfB family radical SAM enzyme